MTPTFSADWFTPHLGVWERALKPFAGRPQVALEIGCFEGRSTVWFLENILTHPDSRIHCVDHFEGGSDHAGMDLTGLRARFDGNTFPWVEKVQVRAQNSWSALRFYPGDTFDWAFIDGSHESQDVLHDVLESYRVVRPGGVLLCDDYGWGLDRDSRPQIGIDAFLSAFKSKVEVLEMGYAVTMRKL